MPARFRFRLEPVLDLRRRREEQHQLAVAALERERLAAEQRLRACRLAIADARADLRDRLAARVGVAAVRLQASASLHLEAGARAAAFHLAGVLSRLESARAGLLRATTDRKAVELLRERRRQAFFEDLNRREHAEVDELIVQRHATLASLHDPR